MLMIGLGGEIDHVFGCAMFALNQITERMQSLANMRDKHT